MTHPHCAECVFCRPRMQPEAETAATGQEPKRDTDYGMCHRYPPQVIPIGRDAYTSAYPQTPLGDWCGEFKAALRPVRVVPD